eukprot:scaffold8527_cov187-Amphora_coffeaeformis.AAC.6
MIRYYSLESLATTLQRFHGRLGTNLASAFLSTTTSKVIPESSGNTPPRKILEREINNAVRSYIEHKFPRAFRPKPTTTKRRDVKSFRTSFTRPTVDTSPSVALACLNGFQSTVPSPTHRVFLAEGVLAIPQQSMFGSAETYSLFVKPSQNVLPTGLPPMIPEDITVYRILENRVEEFLYEVRRSVQDWISTRIITPLERLFGRRVQAEKSAENSIDADRHVTTLRIHHQTGQIQIIAHVQPRHYTLLLPFELEHKPASTLITVSLVVFGAVPLAYRSLNFMWAYPMLSQGIVASVIATVGYGIWSSRSVARTNQALVIQKAILARMQAQDEAAWVVLQDGASKELTKIILNLYQGTPDEDGTDERNQMANEIASRLGLIQENNTHQSLEAAIQSVRKNSPSLFNTEPRK